MFSLRSTPNGTNSAEDSKKAPESELVKLTIEQLYESALLQEGLHLNPGTMLPRIQRLMELATE